MTADLPSLSLLVDAADAGLAATVRDAVDVQARRGALTEELAWWLEVAAQDLDYARSYHQHAPVPGAGPEDYLDRWLAVTDDLWVLAGPRFRARDMAVPFVGIAGASRVIAREDLPALRQLARERFSQFTPLYLALWSGLPAGAWPGTRADSRLLAGRLDVLRRGSTAPPLTVVPLSDMGVYEDYVGLYDQHAQLRPEHRFQARPESREDFAELIAAGSAWSVEVDGAPAGIVAARPGVAGGCRGAVIHELILAPSCCGRGYGRHLSGLLAQQLPMPDEQFLFGTIHVENHSARRAALAAGRQDIGGEVIVDL
jgi:hypothetical protein